MSNFKFTEEIVPTTRGLQKTKYDELLPYFNTPGKTLYFDEEDMKRPAASQAAKRLMVLDPLRKFHSGYNPTKQKVYIRVRPEGEIPSVEESKEEVESAEEE